MAIFHTRVKVFSRKNGESAIAASAYRAGVALLDAMTGIRHDYSRRGGVVANLCLAPKGAPDWAVDLHRVWRAAEDAEKHPRAAIAREFEVSLPHELTDAQRLKLVEAIAQALVDHYGFAIQASIHAPDPPDGLNHHVHLLATTRRMGPSGLGEKTRELDAMATGSKEVKWIRQLVAEKTNAHLAQAGLSVRVDHRRLEVQAIDALRRGDLATAALLNRKPTQHEGKTATAMRKRGEVSERGLVNDQIRHANAKQLRSLMAALRREGRLMETPASHSHEAALRDRSRPTPNAVERAALATAVKLGQLKVGNAPRRVRYKTGDTREDALAESRRAREDEIERLMLDALRIWQDGINTVLRSALGTSGGALLERPALIRQFANRPGFLADVRDFHEALVQAERDASRFRRRMESQERAEVAVSGAETELRRFDTEHPRPGLWTKREWAQRRRAKADRLRDLKIARLTAVEATGPEAQVRYQRRAEKSLELLGQTGKRFADTYVPFLGGLEQSRATPVLDPIQEAEEELAEGSGRRRSSRKPRPRPGGGPKNTNVANTAPRLRL